MSPLLWHSAYHMPTSVHTAVHDLALCHITSGIQGLHSNTRNVIYWAKPCNLKAMHYVCAHVCCVFMVYIQPLHLASLSHTLGLILHHPNCICCYTLILLHVLQPLISPDVTKLPTILTSLYLLPLSTPSARTQYRYTLLGSHLRGSFPMTYLLV